MSKFGVAQESGDGNVFKLFTGVENFKITHVCPTHDELKLIYGENAKEDTYVYNDDIKDENDNIIGTQRKVKIVLFLDNQDEENSIKTKLTYFITKKYFQKKDKTAFQVINLYGGTGWLSEEDINTKANTIISLVSKNGKAYTYDATGIRKSFIGEDKFIEMLRNLLNLGSAKSATDKSLVESQFSEADWNSIFNGTFSMIRSIIKSSPNKIGVLLGVKKTSENKLYQAVFNGKTLRQYSKASGKFDYLRNDFTQAKDYGMYPDVDFGDLSFKLAEYNSDAKPTQVTQTGFGSAPAPSFDASAADVFKQQ